MQVQASDTWPFKPRVFIHREVSTVWANTEAEEWVLLMTFSSSWEKSCFNNRYASTYKFQLVYQLISAAALIPPTSSGKGAFFCLSACVSNPTGSQKAQFIQMIPIRKKDHLVRLCHTSLLVAVSDAGLLWRLVTITVLKLKNVNRSAPVSDSYQQGRGTNFPQYRSCKLFHRS